MEDPDYYAIFHVRVPCKYTHQNPRQDVKDLVKTAFPYGELINSVKIKVQNNKRNKIIAEFFDFTEVFNMLDETIPHIMYNTYKVKTKSLRYQLFRKVTSCVICGLPGQKFKLESPDLKTAHFNLYGIKN